MKQESQINTMPQRCVLETSKQEELLLGYLDQSLAPDSRRSYERHIASCPRCEELLRLQEMVDDTLAGWEPPEVSANFNSRLLARLGEEQAAPSGWRSVFGSWQWLLGPGILRPAVPLALAAVAFIAVLSFRGNHFVEAPQNPQHLQAKDLAQVERALEDMEALQAFSNDSNEANLPDFVPEQVPESNSKKSL